MTRPGVSTPGFLFTFVCMIKGKLKQITDLKYVLERVSEYEIYRYYIGQDFKIGKNINSPFRDDSTPSFSIYIDEDTSMKYIDFGDMKYAGNCVTLVMQMFDLQYGEALKKINQDLIVDKGAAGISVKPQHKKEDKLIQVVSRKFNKEELAYWDKYSITEQELKDNNVYAISKLYIDRVYIPNYKRELRFAYIFDDKYAKIYTPYAADKGFKFITNAPIDQMSGLDKCTGGERVFILSSKKDELVVKKFDHSCSSQNESRFSINKETIEYLKARYPRVYVWFDQDQAGHEAAEYYESEYNLIPVFVPVEYNSKDPSDLVNNKGLWKLQEFMDDLKNLHK